MLRRQSKLLKDSLHGDSDRLVVRVESSWILCSALWFAFLRGSQQRFNRFIPEHDQRGHRLQACWHRFVTACLADPLHDLLAPEFFRS